MRAALGLAAFLLFAGGLIALVATGLFLVEPYYASLTRRDFLGILEAMREAGGGVQAELDAARELAADTGYRIVVANADGTVYVSSVPEFLAGQAQPLPKEQLEFLLTHRAELTSGHVHFGEISENPRGMAVLQLQAALGEGRFLVLTQPLDQVRRAISAISPFFLVIGGFVLLVEFLLVILLSTRMTRPILELAEVSRRLAAGNLQARFPAGRRDELGQLGLSLDIMARRLAASIEELRTANAALAARMRAQEEFVAGASHELKTPMGLVRGYAEAIKLGLYADESERAELADVILAESDHLDRLVRDLAEIAALGGGRSLISSQGDLREIVETAAARFSLPARSRSIHLVLGPCAAVPAVFDRDRLLQVMDNLLSNALRHTPTGGNVRLGLEIQASQGLLVVENEGEGLEARHLPKLFDPFYRVDPSRSRDSGGSGLGLAMVRAIVEAHGGSCSAEVTDRGMRFSVRLPLAQPAGTPYPAGGGADPSS
jgi:signal transduction histidine kinase